MTYVHPASMARRERRRFSPFRVLVLGVAGVLLFLGAGQLGNLLPSIHNPFGSKTIDHSPPAVLHALNDLADYHAASGQFQTTLDIEKDANYLPSFIRGERTLFLASGSVDAVVDFSKLGPDAVRVDGKNVTVTLPPAHLMTAQIDPAQSHVVDRRRGILDRVGSMFSDNPTGEQKLYLDAQSKIGTAAAADDQLTKRAEDNTRAMLTQLLKGLGFTNVSVNFAPAPPGD